MTRDPLTPNAEEVAALRDQVGDGPVVILNLLKYVEPGGREAFAEYAALSGPLLAAQGGSVFYMAEAGPTVAGDDWDTVAMIRFPSIEAFMGLAGNPTYLEKAPALREAALERTLWMVTQPPAE
ncbi:MAG: DUF1330 domain-containing protein [Myxococcota bacterium]